MGRDGVRANRHRTALLAEVERLREENRQLRGTSTPEIEANINRLAFQLGVTLGHLHHTGGRELECLLQRLEAVEVKAARLREEIVRLWEELDENAGVIAVWRRRTSEAEADAAALREALLAIVSRHVHENNSHHPEWIAARAALARAGGAS